MLVLIRSSSVREILLGTLLIVLSGGRTGDFRLSSFWNSEYRVFYCKQEMRACTSGDELVVLYVGTIRYDPVAQTVLQANVASTVRLSEEI